MAVRCPSAEKTHVPGEHAVGGESDIPNTEEVEKPVMMFRTDPIVAASATRKVNAEMAARNRPRPRVTG